MIKTLLVLAACAWLVVALVVYFSQGRLIYHPSSEWDGTPSDQDLDFEDVNLTTADEVTLHGWYIPHPAARGTVLFLHGNAGNITHRPLTMARLHEMRLNVLMLDYRGYGRSQGQPSESGTYLDARAAYEYLINERDIDPKTLITYGRSLGAAVALQLATEREIAAVIAESAFSSLVELSAEIYPYLPVSTLLRHRYVNIDKVDKVNAPIFVAHSRQDELIPFSHGRRLFERAKNPKQFYEMRGSHGQSFLLSGERYINALATFITSVLESR